MRLGDKALDFSLMGVDRKTYSLESFRDAKALVLIFSCNHCPYVQAYEDRMIAVQRDYKDREVVLIAINSNDDADYPEDGFERMIERAKKLGFNFPYLRDDSQEVARSYGATHTPHLFVFDQSRKLCYTGKIDDNWQDPKSVKQRFLRDALDDVLAGGKPRLAETHAIGCTIKWKK
ncbi:MAG: thioredoxin family protein [Elusimicrobia bacterium]|nr:thioredoxin family protein [Elusimicrobiota bacterium]